MGALAFLALADLVASRYHVVATVDGVVIYAPNRA